MAAAVQLSRERVTKFGLEVPSGLTYQGWEPGGEYTKPLTLKNVKLRTQRVRYNILGNHFFSAVYPQSIVLSAGTSYSLPITFRPTGKSLYEEAVELRTSEGVFSVSLKALFPRPALSLPNSLKFGMCAVQDSVTVNFEISNISPVPADFSWEVPSGFEVSPPSGSLGRQETCKLTATFRPQAAEVYSASAICNFGSEESSTETMRLEGIGKYPHVIVKFSGKPKWSPGMKASSTDDSARTELCGGEVVVNFGPVAVGTVAEKWIEVTNISPVPATFSIAPLSPAPLGDRLFGLSEYEGLLSPQASRRVGLLYSPSSLTPHPSLGFFTVRAQGGLGATTVKCVGTPKGPQVSIEESVVNFGNVECGQTATGVMHIRNNSDVSTVFQLQLDAQSVFKVDVLCGQLGPSASQTVIVHFTPHRTIPYYRRVACLVHHQEPLFVYFIGTAFNETVKPVALQPQHITNYQSHARSGISRIPPEQLQVYIKEGQLAPNASGVLLPSGDFEYPPPDQLIPLCQENSPYAQYLHSEHEPSGIPHISADVEVLEFGFCPPTVTSESKLVSLTNHTRGLVCCVWMTSPSDAFHVVPQEREIPPGETGAFAVNFRPGKPSQFYAKEMECFVFYKVLQDYRHADPSTISPPWCITVRASGHTFTPTEETFHPRLTFDPQNVVFPATLPRQPVYRTVVLRNTGDTPLLFHLNTDPTQTFLVKPSHGLLQDSYQVFVLQMLPREAQVYKRIVKCQLNARESNQQELLLSGSGESPSITLDNEGQLFFRPTCVGTTSSSPHSLTNTARLPLHFHWKMMDSDPGILRVEPQAGTILPNETQSHMWHFTPREERHYALKAVLQATLEIPGTGTLGMGNHSPRRLKALLSISGQGARGEIKCDPSSLDCGTVVIGASQFHTLSLFNPGPCTLHYQLLAEVEGSHTQGRRPPTDTSKVVELDSPKGVLHPQSQKQVKVTVRPSQRAQYTAKIKYQLAASREDTDPASTLCCIDVCGAYPTLAVTDVQGEGAASTTSKARMWHMLSINQLNKHLGEEPSASELRYAIATRHSMRRRVPVHTRAIVECVFGAAPLNSESSTVLLMLENRGDVTTEWAFQFPSDMHLEPEYWAETGQLDEVERHELDVITNELFSVQPKMGRLRPGERTTITASFRHSHIGTSRLPVLLKINKGREMLLNWSGVTVDHGQPYIHFTSQKHKFDPVPIGAHAYPRQTYELHNAGDTPVSYEMDTKPLKALMESNHYMSILECLQPRGEIPAGQSAHVEFVFSPLEAKLYMVDLPIHFSTGETTLITFVGEGYHAQHMAEGAAPPESQAIQGVPVQRSIAIPSQPVHLSQEYISFGHLPLFAVVRQLVFIANTSTHTLSFEWDLNSGMAQEILSVQPARGFIQAAQSVACKVTFCSHSSPACYNLDIVCRVTDESRLLSFQMELEEWEGLQEERRHTFTITAADSSRGGAKKAKKRPQTMPKLKSLPQTKVRPQSSDSELRGKYQTLPPIRSSGETYEEWKKKDLSVRSKSRPRARKSSKDQPPVPPAPFLLHLGVTARTHSIPDYAQLFEDLDSFYIDRHAVVTGASAPVELRVRMEEKEVLSSVISQMLRELLEDTNFRSAIQRVVEEPIPYFTQFSSHAELSESTKESAQRHIYAAGLEDLPSAGHPPLQQPLAGPLHSPTLPNGERTLAVQSEAGAEEEEAQSVVSLLEEGADVLETDEKIKHLPEFTALVENVMENTLLNILKEASVGELSISAPVYIIGKPPETV